MTRKLETRLATTSRPPLGVIGTAAVMILAGDRTEGFADCLASCTRLRRPHGVAIAICVADNAAEPQEETVRLLGAEHGIDLRYDYEPRRGRASLRNRALDLALEAGADIAIFIDADATAHPDLVADHVEAMLRLGADAIVGPVDGDAYRPREARRIENAGTNNIALRRWVFDPQGRGIRFDPRLDRLGFEVREFFGDLVRAGGELFESERPVSIAPGAVGPLASRHEPSFDARRARAAVEGRNEIAVARLRHGLAAAAAVAFRHHGLLAVQGLYGLLATRLMGSNDDVERQRAADKARLKLAQASAGVSGLWRPGYEQAHAGRGELVEVSTA